MRYLSLFILILFFYSCKKDKVDPAPEPQPTVSPISSTLHPLLFDTGSYWIYSNGSSSDTVSLTSVAREEMIVTPKTQKDETFILNFESTEFNNYSERFMGAITTRNGIDEGWVYATNLGEGESYGGLTHVARLDTLLVENQEFYNVSQFRVEQGNYFSNDMYLFYSDSTGVIRKEVLSGGSVIETWNLTEYNTVMYPY
jgi:hypothetical protein